MRKGTYKFVLLAGAACALAHASGAFAQSTDAATPANTVTDAPKKAMATATDPGDIVVTARRVEERLQDVPISITVFNQQQISNRNIINAGDLATYTPSLSTNPNYGAEYTSFALRGFVQDQSTAPTVGVYFADVVAPRGPTQGTQAGDGAGPGSLFDLQNVQVLKGPQGTLFGRNTTGGAVLFVPQKPTSSFGGYLEGSYGNYDMKRIQGALNIPLSDVARFRISGDYLSRDGYLKNDSGIGPTDFNDINYYSIRASLVVDLTPDLENYIIASYTHSDTNGTAKKHFACSEDFLFGELVACAQSAREAGSGFYTVQSAAPDPISLLSTWSIINTTTWHASDTLTIKNIASYAQLAVTQRSGLFGEDWQFGIPALGVPVQSFDFASIDHPPGLKSVDQSTMTEELQVQGNSLDGKLTWQAGGYLEVSDPLGQIGTQTPTILPCTNAAALECTDVLGIAFSAASGFAVPVHIGSMQYTVGETHYRDVGLYSQASYALTDKLKLTAGVRYTWDRDTNSSTLVSYTFPVVPPFTGAPTAVCTDTPTTAYTGDNCAGSSKATSHKPTWLVDLDYKPIDPLLLYAKWTRGYRAGGIAINAPTNFRVFGPEKVDAYEGGLKATFHGPVKGTFNVAGFYNNFSHQQIQAGFFAAPGAAVSSTAGPVNAGKSELYGGEVESSISFLRNFWIDGSYTYLKTKIKSIASIVSTDPNYIVSYQILPGDPLLLAPRNKFSLTARYTLPLDQSAGQIQIGATVTHSDHIETTYAYLHNADLRAAYGGADLGRIAGYTLLNLNMDWKNVAGLPFDLSLFATNVTAKKYYTYVAGLGSLGFESANVGEPRMYGARLRYRFGH
jgi:iron complex outermembrane receptor protein